MEVLWRGRARYLYFQDGAMFLLRPDARGVDVLARYRSGEIAALAAPSVRDGWPWPDRTRRPHPTGSRTPACTFRAGRASTSGTTSSRR
ncbi:hypothetical protein ACFQ0O_15420 [Saccharopolyspora spinosporotrichia]